MLTGIKVAFLGGDARQLEVIKRCVEQDAAVILFGFDNLETRFPGTLLKKWVPANIADIDVLVLPIVSCDDDGFVESIFTSQPLQINSSYLEQMPKHAVIYTGMARDYLKDICRPLSLSLVELLNRDDVAIYNSIPTAEGALMLAIQNTSITIHGSHIAVVGFGRTGATLARMLDALGAHVRVGVRESKDMARVYEMGMLPFHTDQLELYVDDIDILFNTVPSSIITAGVIAQMMPETVIIDLASKPGGTDFRYAEKRGIKAILAPSLPGVVAPKTAGNILANILTRLIFEKSRKGE
jgi:dipicolinate synthase subunit A